MGGMDGIETGKQIRKLDKDVKIIYVTSYRDYVSGAFECTRFNISLKPLKEAAVCQVMEDLFLYLEKPKAEVLDFSDERGNRLVCRRMRSSILNMQTGRSVLYWTAEYRMSGKIGSVIERLEPYGFSMPHQSFVVNLYHVKNVSGGIIFLDNGAEIPIAQKSRRYGSRNCFRIWRNVWRGKINGIRSGNVLSGDGTLPDFTICALGRLCGQFRKQFRRNSGNGFLHGSDMHFIHCDPESLVQRRDYDDRTLHLLFIDRKIFFISGAKWRRSVR